MRNGVLEKVASLKLQTDGHREFLQSSDGLKWTGLRWDNPSLRAHDDSSSRGKKHKTAWSSTRGKMGHKWLNVLLIRGNARVKSSPMHWRASVALLLDTFAHSYFKNTLVGKRHNLKKSFKGIVHLNTKILSSFMHP